MKFNNYMGKFASSGDVQTAIDNGDLVKPYVALVDGEGIDWNTKFIDYTKMYFTIEALENGVLNFGFLKYSVNNNDWITPSTLSNSLAVKKGDRIRFKQKGRSLNNFFQNNTLSFNAYGNIMSLLYEDDFTTAISINSSFSSLFMNCNGLTDVSNLLLPATTLSTYCYESMFQNCTSLTTAPELPATTLAISCYRNMFNGCSSLTNAPVLPATTLARECYSQMFYSCTSLTAAPEFPATTLASNCYNSMFNGCTSLTTAPELPATTLADSCYRNMFNGCSNLNYIKCLATDISASSCVYNWLYGVSSTGTFVKAAGVSWTSGISGIPTGWTVQEV